MTRPPAVAGYLGEVFALDELTAVVTGGGSGSGRAIATALARAGARPRRARRAALPSR
jgi:NAD(P)-dependent dehydrogenase (short-subunit alcohol dehydrogenase family)